MSKGKTAKTASKNNPTARAQGIKYLIDGKEVKPVQIVINDKNFWGAEDESGTLVVNQKQEPLSWSQARLVAIRN